MTISISIKLTDLIPEPEQDIDLTVLPSAEAADLIKQAFGFLGTVEVSISDGMATITAPGDPSQSRDEARRLFSQGVKSAQQGKYRQAIRSFEEALDIAPEQADIRRNLGLAYMELGDADRAKTYVREVIRLDPHDAWSFLLLGNIAWKQERDYDLAIRYYQKAYENKPDDPYLLNNYGAILAEHQQYAEAEIFLRRAMAAQPDYPNPYLALAVLHLDQNHGQAALQALDELFAAPRSQDIRSRPVYEEAQRRYLEANRAVAEATYDEVMQLVEERRQALEQSTGQAIRIEEDRSQSLPTVAQLAWAHQRDYHLIKYHSEARAAVPNLLLRSLEHIAREIEVRQAGRARLFRTTATTKAHAQKFLDDYVPRLKRRGLSPDAIDESVNQIIEGLALQLFNSVLDMMVEYRVYQKYSSARSSQFVSLHAIYQQSLPAVTDPSYKQLFPRTIYNANIAMTAAYALFLDYLYPGKTDYVTPYKGTNQFATAQRLFKLWQDALTVFEPGDEYILTDEFARELRLQEWYEWQTDLSALPDQPGGPEGVTNPELLKENELASAMHCLGALERYENLPLERVREIAFEIAILGRDGIDYASTESKYTLRSLPGEHFTGLQLLAYMYVGFQKIDPALNTTLDLKGAYEIALKMYRPKSS